jgi:hypothetical protein
MQKNRRIYSLNIIAYLVSKNIVIAWGKDDNNNYYGTVEEDVSSLLTEYKSNVELQKFLHSYRIIRQQIKELNI